MPMQGYQQIDPQAFSNLLKGFGAMFGMGDLKATVPSAPGTEGTGEGQSMAQVYGANPGLKFETTGGDFWDRIYGRQAMQANNQIALGQYGNNMMLSNDATMRSRTTNDMKVRGSNATDEDVRRKVNTSKADREIKRADLEYQDQMATDMSPSVRYYGTAQQQGLRAAALGATDQASLLGTGLPYSANLRKMQLAPQLEQAQLDNALAQQAQIQAQTDQIRAQINEANKNGDTNRAHQLALTLLAYENIKNAGVGHYASLGNGAMFDTKTGTVMQPLVPGKIGGNTIQTSIGPITVGGSSGLVPNTNQPSLYPGPVSPYGARRGGQTNVIELSPEQYRQYKQ